MYDYGNPIDRIKIANDTVRSRLEWLERIKPELLLPGESCNASIEPKGFAVRVEVVSRRAPLLLTVIQERVFRSFGRDSQTLQGGDRTRACFRTMA